MRGVSAALGLIEVIVPLCVAVGALLVLLFDALGRVLMGAVVAIARAPWRGGRELIRSQKRTPVSLSCRSGRRA